MSLSLFLVCIIAGLVGAALYWLIERPPAVHFLAVWAALSAALLVYSTQSILGLHI